MRSVGAADGSIMPSIIAVHMAKSSARCAAFHEGVIIHAEAPVMSPYMSRAIGTIHAQQAPATSSSEPSTSQRSYVTARSREVRSITTTLPGARYRTTPCVDQCTRARCA